MAQLKHDPERFKTRSRWKVVNYVFMSGDFWETFPHIGVIFLDFNLMQEAIVSEFTFICAQMFFCCF